MARFLYITYMYSKLIWMLDIHIKPLPSIKYSDYELWFTSHATVTYCTVPLHACYSSHTIEEIISHVEEFTTIQYMYVLIRQLFSPVFAFMVSCFLCVQLYTCTCAHFGAGSLLVVHCTKAWRSTIVGSCWLEHCHHLIYSAVTQDFKYRFKFLLFLDQQSIWTVMAPGRWYSYMLTCCLRWLIMSKMFPDEADIFMFVLYSCEQEIFLPLIFPP